MMLWRILVVVLVGMLVLVGTALADTLEPTRHATAARPYLALEASVSSTRYTPAKDIGEVGIALEVGVDVTAILTVIAALDMSFGAADLSSPEASKEDHILGFAGIRWSPSFGTAHGMTLARRLNVDAWSVAVGLGVDSRFVASSSAMTSRASFAAVGKLAWLPFQGTDYRVGVECRTVRSHPGGTEYGVATFLVAQLQW